VADLSICPSCGSGLVQPLRWQEQEGEHELDLRCPECFALMRGTFEAADVEALDRTLRAARDSINAAYESSVRETMEAVAHCLERALALDLVSADDFAARRPEQYPRAA
jgi:hypothetical protein